MSLLQGSPRVLFVTGKGGVGKTTVTTALGLAAAARGEETLIVETAGARQVAPRFQRESAGYTAIPLAPHLWTLSVTPEDALEDYVVQQVRFARIYELVFRNRVMGPFVDAVPGLHDAVQLGKVFDLQREQGPRGPRWQRILVDAPATGHGLTMLGAARAMMDLTRAGPLYEGVKQVHDVLDDPRMSGVVLVSLPEEMPVNETLDLHARLEGSAALVRGVVLNACAPWSPDRAALEPLRPLLEGGPQADILRHVDLRIARMARQAEAARRLDAALPCPRWSLPDLRLEGQARGLDPAALQRLGAALDGPPERA